MIEMILDNYGEINDFVQLLLELDTDESICVQIDPEGPIKFVQHFVTRLSDDRKQITQRTIDFVVNGRSTWTRTLNPPHLMEHSAEISRHLIWFLESDGNLDKL